MLAAKCYRESQITSNKQPKKSFENAQETAQTLRKLITGDSSNRVRKPQLGEKGTPSPLPPVSAAYASLRRAFPPPNSPRNRRDLNKKSIAGKMPSEEASNEELQGLRSGQYFLRFSTSVDGGTLDAQDQTEFGHEQEEVGDEREMCDVRGEIYDEREEVGNEREICDERGEIGGEREEVGDEREICDVRGEIYDEREEVGNEREIYDERGEIGDERGEIGDERREIGDEREEIHRRLLDARIGTDSLPKKFHIEKALQIVEDLNSASEHTEL